MKLNDKQEALAELIYEGLTKQHFVDWYEQTFVPFIQDEEMCGSTKEQILAGIVKVFRIEE